MLIDVIKFIVELFGWIAVIISIIGFISITIAWFKGILIPLYRLGIGLSRRDITIVGNQIDCDTLFKLISNSRLFVSKNITKICSEKDIEDIKKTSVILFNFNNSPITLKKILEHKKLNTALVIYAKPNEIKGPLWEELDKHRNVSVCNLRGRLLNDLLTLMMTTSYEK